MSTQKGSPGRGRPVRGPLLPVALAAALLLGAGPDARADPILIGLNPLRRGPADLLLIQTDPFSVSVLGTVDVPSLSGLTFQPGTNTLFASTGNEDGGRLYTLDLNTSTATLLGPIGFTAVPAITFARDGTLYGSVDFGTDQANGLIVIDPDTGRGTLVGLYGSVGPNVIQDVNGIAFDPRTGVLYSGTGRRFDGTPGDIFTIDPATGAATLLGSLTEAGTGAPIPADLAGLAFDPEGNLFGSLGQLDGRIFVIDLPSLTFRYLGDAVEGPEGSVSDIAPLPAGVAVPVPEPGSLVLFAVGTLGLLSYGWRRRKRAA